MNKKEKKIIEIIEKIENPYPKDVFNWDNKEKINFKRGRFNQHCFEICENCKHKILEELKDVFYEDKKERRREKYEH